MILRSEATKDLLSESRMSTEWFVYIIECRTADLYVGIAKDVIKRVRDHNKGYGARYTKFRRPVKLLYFEKTENYNLARKREQEIKKFSREKKLILINNKISHLEKVRDPQTFP